MGRARFDKRDHVEKMNRLFESRNKRSIMTEQLGTNSYGCDLSCVDTSDSGTDNMVMNGGGPNSIQPYDATTTYAPGSVVCNLDPGTNVTNIFVASANSGVLVPGGGPYPEPEEGVTAFSFPLPPGTPTSDYYWEPGLTLASCAGAGDWWCDPTGQYVGPTGSPCLQSPTQPQSYFTGPSTTEQDCIAQCGTTSGISGCMNPLLGGYDPNATVDCLGNPQPAAGYGDESCCGMPGPQEYVCMGGVVGPGGTNSCTGPHPMGTYQMGDPNVMGIYPTQNDCDAACVSNTGASCDFSWTSSCSQTHLQTGGQNSWTNFLTLRETGFDSVGCQHLQNVVNWNTDQLNSGVTGSGAPLNPTQIARKTEKLAWAQCQANECGCSPLNVPPLTGGPTPTGNNSHENFTGTVCNCVGDCSSPSGQIGAGFQAASATHQCNGQMCTDTGGPNGTGDIGQIFDYDDGSKTLTFTLNSFSTPGIFGVSQTPGINMPSATCPVTPVAPPNPLAGTGGIKPEKKEKEEKEEKKLNEEINRMKSLWGHN